MDYTKNYKCVECGSTEFTQIYRNENINYEEVECTNCGQRYDRNISTNYVRNVREE